MRNIVDEMDALKKRLEIEKVLRDATDVAMRNQVLRREAPTGGVMKLAHDAAIEDVIEAAGALLTKVGTDP